MRVTNNMLTNSYLRDMRMNLSNMQKIQEQMTSGKEIRRPSDDPFKAERIMQINREIDANKQYNENITDTINWLDTTDTSLGQAGDVLQRVRELLVSSGNAGYSDKELKAIKDEVNEKVGQFSQILNTNFDGSYIFGGTRSTTKPVDVAQDGENKKMFYYKKGGGELQNGDAELDMIDKKLSVQISQGVTMEYNVNATEVVKYGSDDKDDIRALFTRIVNHLDGNNDSGTKDPNAVKELVGNDLDDITKALDNVLRIRAEVGAKQNRMDDAKGRNEDQNFNMTEILSKTEDIDLTEKTMEFSTMRTVYTASLQTSAKVIQPTLMDYLR